MFPIILYHHLLSILEDPVCIRTPVFAILDLMSSNLVQTFMSATSWISLSAKRMFTLLLVRYLQTNLVLTSSKEHAISPHHYGRLYLNCNLKTNYCDCKGNLVLYFYGGKLLCCGWIQDTVHNTQCIRSIFFPMEIFHCILFVRYFCQVFLPPLCKT